MSPTSTRTLTCCEDVKTGSGMRKAVRTPGLHLPTALQPLPRTQKPLPVTRTNRQGVTEPSSRSANWGTPCPCRGVLWVQIMLGRGRQREGQEKGSLGPDTFAHRTCLVRASRSTLFSHAHVPWSLASSRLMCGVEGASSTSRKSRRASSSPFS